MLILDVDSRVHEQRGVRKKDGSDYVIRYQEAKIVRKGHLDRIVKISIPGEGQYASGLHTVSAKSFRPGDFEKLIMGFVDLIPLESALQAAEKQLKAARAGRKSA